MYELLTGTRPFRAGNLQKLLHQIVFATPPPIHTLRPEIPEELENVTAMALQKEPEKRYKTGLDLPPNSRACIKNCARNTTASISRNNSACCAN